MLKSGFGRLMILPRVVTRFDRVPMPPSPEEPSRDFQNSRVGGFIDGLNACDTRRQIRTMLIHIVLQFELRIARAGYQGSSRMVESFYDALQELRVDRVFGAVLMIGAMVPALGRRMHDHKLDLLGLADMEYLRLSATYPNDGVNELAHEAPPRN